MLWIVLLILAILAAYFIYNHLCARHIARCQDDTRTSEHVPDKLTELNGQDEAYNAVFNNKNNNQPNASVPAPHESPSLLYADRKDSAEDSENENVDGSQGVQVTDAHMTRAENLPINESLSTADSMDLTAETATLSSEEVGIPANSSDYTQPNHAENTQSAVETDAFKADGDRAANAQVHDEQSNVHTSSNQTELNDSSANSTNSATIAAVAAGVAGAAAASSFTSEPSTQQQIRDSASDTPTSTRIQASNEGIDLELGDNTHNTTQEFDENHDELLDFGDLTADISEMLKELNLRESDSPRLEINEAEYQQLKTGEPGEVKPEKIEGVAGKLRNMLQ